MKKKSLLFVFGTRPEALKLAPVIMESQKRQGIKTLVCATGQHREMADQVLKLFKIKPDFDLNIMRPGQSLGELTARIIPEIEKVFRATRPDCVIVQGDTSTAFVVALQAFYDKIPVAHVEAGLRSGNKYHPFPEEINRVLISKVADIHFPPTRESYKNLIRENANQKNVHITGNTIVDALKFVRAAQSKRVVRTKHGKRIILVTAHRRESFGTPFEMMCKALRAIADRFHDAEIIYPVHLNPNVQKPVNAILGNHPRIKLIPPVNYTDFISLMEACYFIITDSGGIQEEAPSFGKPVLVMRNVSERPDGIKLGVAKLVGTKYETILGEASKLLLSEKAYRKMIRKKNPYGDGKASVRILNLLERFVTKDTL